MQKIQKQGFCIFCGKTGLTKEHLISQWIGKIIPERIERFANNQSRTFFRDGKLHLVPPVPVRKFNHDISALKHRVVCVKCNGGWMSQLESTVQPYLSELITGKNITLSEIDVFNLCRWVILKCIIGEHIDPNNIAIHHEQRKQIMNGVIPNNWNIWLGKYGGEGRAIRHTNSFGTLVLSDQLKNLPSKHNFYSSYFILGELFIQTTWCALFEKDEFPYNKKLNEKIVQIWPTRYTKDCESSKSISLFSTIKLTEQEVQTLSTTQEMHYLPRYNDAKRLGLTH